MHGGRIRVGDGQGTLVEALLVEDGRVAALGTLAEVRSRLGAGQVRELDLAGAVAVPGLQDAHVRLEELGAALRGLDLSGIDSEEGLLGWVAGAVASRPAGTWIVAQGWDAARLGLAGWPEARRLDGVAPGHPVALWSADRRVLLVNGKALEAADIGPRDPASPRPRPGDGVLRDEEGRPTGVLLDAAVARVAKVLPAVPREERIARLLAAQEHLLARGVGAVHDLGARADLLPIYRELAQDGRLRLRVLVYLAVDPDAGQTLATALEAARDFGREPGPRVRVAGLAARLDGGLGSRGAALLEPYADRPGDSGRLAHEEGPLMEFVTAAARVGLQPALIATGDRAARLALDVVQRGMLIEPALRRLRPRVEDGLLASTRDWPRFPEIGAALVLVPRGAAESDRAATRVGLERWRRSRTWQRLAPRLGPVALGSRAPEGEVGPLVALHRLRFGPGGEASEGDGDLNEELPDGRLALAGATSAAAWAAREEDRRGRLLPGYFADLTVLSFDPVVCGPEDLAAARVLAVLLEGALVGGELAGTRARAEAGER